MNLNQLYYFQKVAKLQHYHQAARELNISQPSLSRSISNLEEELGLQLFKKNGRNIELTKYGKIFLEHVNRILEEVKIAEDKMRSFAASSGGHIDIGYVFPLAKSYIPHLVRSFLNREQNQGITFSLNQEITKDLIRALKTEKYDVIFGSKVPEETEIEFIPVVNQEMVIIVPPGHPLKYKKPLLLEDLTEYPVVGYDRTSGLGQYTNSIYRQNHMQSLKDNDIDVIGKKMTITGAGGAATAIEIQAALDGVKEMSIFNIKDKFWENAEKTVEKIRENTDCVVNLYDLDDKEKLREEIADSYLFAQATGVGMKPLEGQSVVPDKSFFRPDLIVTDTIYAPRETALLKMAKEVGCKTMNGLGMMLFQGDAAFHLWTGKHMPIDHMKEVLDIKYD